MPKIRLVFKMLILFFTCSIASAQTFMGIEQSKSLKLQKYQTPPTPVQPMTSQDFKGAVGSMSEQTQSTITKDINKKLLPPPEPFNKTPTNTPNQTTTTETTSTTVTTTPQTQSPVVTPTAPSAPVTNNPIMTPPTSQMAPAPTAPSSTPVYSGFQGQNNNQNTNTPPPARSGGSNTSPAKSSGWNINY